MTRTLEFRIARRDWEFEQIHGLNYRTFVEEIPQHQPNRDEILVDQFHDENTYLVCVDGERVVGMIAVRGNRPFSLDRKLADLDSFLPESAAVCEFRLLAIEEEYRHGPILRGLIARAAEHCLGAGYDLGVISGTTRQQRLYRHIGFEPFGPLVGTEEAQYQPMYLTLAGFRRGFGVDPGIKPSIDFNFLPGPVESHPAVHEAFASPPVSHRSSVFLADLREVKGLLSDLVGARHVALLLGSGTLANDAIAAHLSVLSEPGLVLCNGEFGRRLVDHARRVGLDFDVLEVGWGETFDIADLVRAVEPVAETGWLWTAHCETSTGVLNDVEAIERLCVEKGVRLCLDCISSIGTVPVNLANAYLASCVSGKGLGSYPGLSMVFHNHEIEPAAERLPRYLDLGLYGSDEAVPFTHSSNLVCALRAALWQLADADDHFRKLERCAADLRSELRELGFRVVAADAVAAPAVVSIELPPGLDSKRVGEELDRDGFLLSYRSEYLLERNWIQICLMGTCSPEKLAPLVDELRQFTRTRSSEGSLA